MGSEAGAVAAGAGAITVEEVTAAATEAGFTAEEAGSIAGKDVAAEISAEAQALTNARGGELVHWGSGQGAAGVAETEAAARGLTSEGVRQMVEDGLTRPWVESMAATYERMIGAYEKAAAEGTKLGVDVNKQLVPRLELMKGILDLWPK